MAIVTELRYSTGAMTVRMAIILRTLITSPATQLLVKG